MEVPLSEVAIITLNSSGNGTASIGPNVPGVTWLPASVSISMSGSIPSGVATCFIYAGSNVQAANFVDSTYNVIGAASGIISGQQINVGQQIFAVWSGGNANATATLTVSGTKTIPG